MLNKILLRLKDLFTFPMDNCEFKNPLFCLFFSKTPFYYFHIFFSVSFIPKVSTYQEFLKSSQYELQFKSIYHSCDQVVCQFVMNMDNVGNFPKNELLYCFSTDFVDANHILICPKFLDSDAVIVHKLLSAVRQKHLKLCQLSDCSRFY